MTTPVDPSRTGDLRAADDAALVEAFRTGRREAFDVIVERHRRQVYLVCYRFAGSHEDAADLAQDVFVRAFRGLKTFKGAAALSTWLHRIAVNTALNRAALKRPVTEPIGAEPHADTSRPSAFDTIARAETIEAVRNAIRRLPPRQRATLILRVYHDLSYEGIARVLGSSVGAAKANVFHALTNLRKRMTP